ncbi:MAG: lytic transglycosylase domain-containing protein [Gammaproteobacteria bacterium]
MAHCHPLRGKPLRIWVVQARRTVGLMLVSLTLQASVHNLETAWAEFLDAGISKQPAFAFPYESCFRRAATAHDLPLVLLLAVARGESDFESRAVSSANAYGLMQIQWPGTAQHLGISRLKELYDPCTNIDAGARYLRELLQRYGGSLHRALAAYNYGPSRIGAGAARLPSGAQRYSAYIYQHLAYVLGRGDAVLHPSRSSPYNSQRQVELMNFTRACRAEAYAKAVQHQSPSLDIDWFQSPSGGFRVVLSYARAEDLSDGLQAASLARVPWTCEETSDRTANRRGERHLAPQNPSPNRRAEMVATDDY